MESICREANDRVEAYLQNPDASNSAKECIRVSQAILEQVIAKFPAQELAMSFNGGKDCLVMLYLILAQFHRSGLYQRLPTIYIRVHDSFPEVDDFVARCTNRFCLDVVTSDKPMKEALEEYLNSNVNIKAVFVGIRRTDPWAQSLEHIQRTDHGWPDFVRVHPMLDWGYSEVWNFLLGCHIEYCSLYDQGYTSLGGTHTTIRNPLLRRDDGSYMPAYKLEDVTSERAGRCKK